MPRQSCTRCHVSRVRTSSRATGLMLLHVAAGAAQPCSCFPPTHTWGCIQLAVHCYPVCGSVVPPHPCVMWCVSPPWPSSISICAIPAGSQARMLLTYISLVEGGRLKARREASMVGVKNRLAARGWRCSKRANTQEVGWPGLPASSPACDPLHAQIHEHVDERAAHQEARERR